MNILNHRLIIRISFELGFKLRRNILRPYSLILLILFSFFASSSLFEHLNIIIYACVRNKIEEKIRERD